MEYGCANEWHSIREIGIPHTAFCGIGMPLPQDIVVGDDRIYITSISPCAIGEHGHWRPRCNGRIGLLGDVTQLRTLI